MIPKIIHFCWFGFDQMSELETNCIESWKETLPEYQIILWSESSLDFEKYTFANAAYKAGKYAFVSDYVRLLVLYEFGGIYLDTDMIVLKNFDEFLHYDFFAGEYIRGNLNAAIIGSKPKNSTIKSLLEVYESLNFDILNIKTIPEVFDEIIWSKQCNSIKIFPPEYFYPMPLENKGHDYSGFITENTFAVHLWNHSWKDEFALLREGKLIDSLYLAINHLYKYPKVYWNRKYFKNYFFQFKRHLKKDLRNFIYGKA